MRFRPSIGLFAICLLLTFFAPWGTPDAWALRPFFELGAGLTKIFNPSPLFTATSATNYGMSYVVGAGFEMTNPQNRVQLSVGAHVRTHNGLLGDTYYGLQTIYPQIRIEFSRYLINFGISPYVRTREATTKSVITFTQVSNAQAYFLEMGYRYIITPKLMFYSTVAGEVIKTNNLYGPRPAIEVSGYFKFFLWGPATFVFNKKRFGDGMEKDDYEGWRYPFGHGQ